MSVASAESVGSAGGPGRGSVRAYARHRGCSHQAVRKAIQTRRLTAASVADVAGRVVVDFACADAEWRANTQALKRRPRADAAPAAVLAIAGAALPADMRPTMSLVEATALEKEWRARLTELEFRTKAGALVVAAEAQERMVAVFGECRTKLLGVPRRAKALLPHLTHTDLVTIDRLIRETLEALADGATS